MGFDSPVAMQDRQTIISELDGELQHQIDRLGSLAAELARRIEPILVPESASTPAPGNRQGGPGGPLSVVRASLGVYSVRVRSIADELQAVLERVDL